MYPVLFHLGSLPISTYSLAFLLGSLAGLALAAQRGREYGLATATVLEAAVCAFLAGGLVGRLGYVVANWEFFSSSAAEALNPWRGGSSAPLALLGGLLGLYAWAGRRATPEETRKLLDDALAPALALGSAFVWTGCLLSGAAYGRTGSGPLNPILPDIYGVGGPRFPTQALGLALSLGVLAIVWAVQRSRPRSGLSLALTVALLSCVHFALAFTQGDDPPVLWGLRVEQWVDLLLVVLCVGSATRLIFER